MAICECTAWASRRPARPSYTATPVSSHEVSMPRSNIALDFDTIQPLSETQVDKGLDADRTSQGKRAVRSRDAPLQAHGREDRPAHRAALARVLRETDRRAQAQARRRGEAPPQASAQSDASAEALLALSSKSPRT